MVLLKWTFILSLRQRFKVWRNQPISSIFGTRREGLFWSLRALRFFIYSGKNKESLQQVG